MSLKNITRGPTDPSIRYGGPSWTKVNGNDNFPASFTTSDDASVTFNFEGTYLLVEGWVDSDSAIAPLSYSLDGINERPSGFNATATVSSKILYSSPQLLSGPHSFQLNFTRSGDGIHRLWLSGMTYTVNAKQKSGIDLTTPQKVGIAAGSVAFLAVVVILGFLLCGMRKRRRRNAAAPPLGDLHVAMPTSKEAFTSRNYSNHGFSFGYSPESANSKESFTPLPSKAGHKLPRPSKPTLQSSSTWL